MPNILTVLGHDGLGEGFEAYGNFILLLQLEPGHILHPKLNPPLPLPPCLWIARPGFESRPGASPQCGLSGSISHCNTV